MHLRYFIIVTLLITAACGKEQPRSPWPAHIAAMDGMSEEEKTEVKKVVEELNTLAGSTVITFDPAPSHFSIAVKKNDPSQDVSNRAGFATVGLQNCAIDLSSLIFNADMKDYIRPVIFHELGHCAGLDHSDKEGDIMFKSTVPNASYTDDSISSFVQSFRAGAGL